MRQGYKVVDIVDSRGMPLTIYTAVSNQSEVNLIEPALDHLPFEDVVPEHLVYDRAADSDPLHQRLQEERGVELVCPHRKSRQKPSTQDGRACLRYIRRYKVERTHSWFHNYRRTIIRYETTLARYTGWIHLACLILTLKRF